MFKRRPRKTPRDDLMIEISSQFPEVTLTKGEEIEKELKESIFIPKSENITDDNDCLIESPGSVHPNLEVIIDKFDARVKKKSSTKTDIEDGFVIEPDYKYKKKTKKNEQGFFILKDLLKKFKS